MIRVALRVSKDESVVVEAVLVPDLLGLMIQVLTLNLSPSCPFTDFR